MNQNILDQLEFDKVKKIIATFLQTEQGATALDALEPMTDRLKIARAFDELRDMTKIAEEGTMFSLGQLRDVSESLRRLELETDINIPEMIAIKKLLQVSADMLAYYRDLDNVSLQALNLIFDKIDSFPSLQGSLQAINDGGFIEDFASPELGQIRRRIRSHETRVRQILQDILKKQAEYLTEPLIASRNGRAVLPVKNTHRNRLTGVVHDISGTGTTVYIEPRAVVTLNEELTQLQADERHELARVLSELSDRIRPAVGAIRNNAWLLGHLDLVRAKFAFMREKKAIVPTLSTDNTVQLLQVRHPLLTHPVANDIHFTDDVTAIVITGPNTGGKTVLLKTLGLAQVMGQSGLPILADEGSQLAVFHDIFADIGDEQSIEQSLSTFSSHMSHIIAILEAANEHSLVLVDELGAGTDPQEGASLAMAILEHLRLANVKTLATTHYPELKAYGIETPHVENASMAFDTETLSPTYRFLQGVPGRSNAFEIARRLGLYSAIVTTAEEMTRTDSDVNAIIEQLEEQTLASQKRLTHIREIEQENLKFNRAVKKLYNEFSHAKDKELEKAAKEARQIVDLALEESQTILENLHTKATLKPHEVIEANHQLKKLAPQVDLSKNKVLKKAKKSRQPHVGDNIIVTAYGQHGTLIKQVKEGKWEAQIGLIKMTLSEAEFTLAKTEQRASSSKKPVTRVKKQAKTSSPHARLDLRGKRYEQAMQELDAFIDQALLNNMSQVDIIHGIGTGVIREGVTTYLRRNKHVKQFHYAPQNAGGSGCTIATLG